MKLTIKRSEFARMLYYTSQVIPAKSAEAQFMNFLIEVNADGLTIVASDGKTSVKATQNMKDEKGNDVIFACDPGKIQAPAKTLFDMVNKLSGDVVTLTMVDTNYLNISDEDSSSSYNLVTRNGEEYPDVDLAVDEELKGFTVPLTDLKVLFDTTAYAVATKGPKELYYGINVTAKEGKLYFLTTDSCRLARLSVAEANQDADFTFTCPVLALDMITKIAESGNCTIYFDDMKCLFVTDNITISSRLYRGTFPSLDRLIPESFPYAVTLDTSEFLKAADRLKVITSYSNDKNSLVRLTLSKETGCTLSAKSENIGDNREVIRNAVIELGGDEIFEIGFNVDFAIDAVKALKSEKVTFVFCSVNRMFMVKNDNPENYQIITPIRLHS